MELVVFVLTAAIAVVGALAMLLSRNAVHSALFLLLNFGAIAVMYLLLRAPFLFAVQLIVYAGAIIVLFLFVIMLLGAERAEDERDRNGWQRPLAIGLGVVLLAEALYVLFTRAQSQAALATPATPNEGLGDPLEIGRALFTTYLLPFEITSVVLLAAIIGVVVLSRKTETRAQTERELAEGDNELLTTDSGLGDLQPAERGLAPVDAQQS
ncbi:MAG TPA: NADH-quinone oxidoreductase subunit J [Roseiflexaceae bacterium]|nr:NADH-quinone oxidoreductase subunit J [Roseiflexaceae bacterium]